MCRGAAILLLGCVAHAHFPSDSDDHDVDSDSAAGPRRDYTLEPGQFGVDFRLYLKNNTSADPQEVAPGVTVRCWDGKGSEASPDFSAVAPAMTRIDFAAGKKRGRGSMPIRQKRLLNGMRRKTRLLKIRRCAGKRIASHVFASSWLTYSVMLVRPPASGWPQ